MDDLALLQIVAQEDDFYLEPLNVTDNDPIPPEGMAFAATLVEFRGAKPKNHEVRVLHGNKSKNFPFIVVGQKDRLGGASGSPIIDFDEHEVVGVFHSDSLGESKNEDLMGIAVRSSRVLRLLEKAERQKALSDKPPYRLVLNKDGYDIEAPETPSHSVSGGTYQASKAGAGGLGSEKDHTP